MSIPNSTAALLVPIASEALIMNSYVRTEWKAVMWRRFTPDWRGFASSSMTPPYNNTGSSKLTSDNDGVYLHWALPAALTRATVTDQAHQSMSLPDVPNRWLVARVGPAVNGTRPLRAWVIQSDYLTHNQSAVPAGTSAFVHPFLSQAGQLVPARLGTHIDITAYQGDLPSDADGGQSFLYASGPGDVSFAAYEPGVHDVFAFFDAEIIKEGAGKYDYLVAGWHAGPSKDPLSAGGDWAALLQSLNWKVQTGPNAPGQGTPSAASLTVYHSSCANVAWQGVANPTGPEAALSEDAIKGLGVYIGSNTLDALCTALQQQAGTSGPEYARHLQAFILGMLPQLATPGGTLQVEEAIERSRFASTNGGTEWAVVPARPGAQTLPPFTADEQQRLDALNIAQATFDTVSRGLAALQAELYGTWWKTLKARQYSEDFTPENLQPEQWQVITADLATQLTDQPGTIYSAVKYLMDQRDALKNLPALNASADELHAYATTTLNFDPAWTIKALPQPRFYQPADPVVLVTGLPANLKYANENSNPPGGLPCRFSTQIVAGISYQNATDITAESLGSLVQVPSNGALPAAISMVVEALTRELFFLNDANATLIAPRFSGVDAGVLQRQMQARESLLGTAPAASAFTSWTQQPFSPLYLEWNVQFCPTPFEHMNGWSFNGDDYVFSDELSSAVSQTYAGRTVITPHAADIFTQRVRDYVAAAKEGADPDLAKVLALLENMRTPDILSQALSDFHSRLLMRHPGPNYPPAAAYADAIGPEYRFSPYTDLVQNLDMRGGPRYFFPVRAGFFRFVNLRIADTFGQTIDLLAANQNPIPIGTPGEADHFTPYMSSELALDRDTKVGPLLFGPNWMRLPPRAVQTARLNVELLPTNGPHTTPVHGWLVPNHLDRAISVYDAQGNALGEIIAVLDTSTGATTTAMWVPAVSPSGSDSTPDLYANEIGDSTLSAVVNWLIRNAQDGRLLRTFLDVIDETLWSVNPLGARSDANLSVLMGQPLAVVDLQLNLELEGDPAHDQSFTESYRRAKQHGPATADLLAQPFAVQLGDLQRGDDGVIGYFTVGQDYFNAVVDPAKVDPSGTPSSFVRVIGQNGNWLSLSYDPTSVQHVTALVDPRGSIHARTGALPVTTTTIPDQFTQAALSGLSVSFRSGPLLTDASVIRIPKPAEQAGRWLWLGYQPVGGASGNLVSQPVVNADDIARLDGQPNANEGYLQFTPAKAAP